MIMTIGSLVQETFRRRRGFIAIGLYTIACVGTSSLLGAFLSSVGLFLHQMSCSTSTCTSVYASGPILVGVLAIAYAFSDAGLIRLPRPRVMAAVPVTWWRWWRPYGAALAYGGALGLGVTTRIEFGAFYILCLWCVLKGEIWYGVALIGTYGIARALMLPPISCYIYRNGKDSNVYFTKLVNQFGNAKIIVAIALAFFGTMLLVTAFL